MKKFLEKAVRWLLTASGFVTSLVILLIIAFLFAEGAGLFREHTIEEGYVLALHGDNPVYFSEEQLGAQYENAGRLISSLIASRPGMIAFIPESMADADAGLSFIEDNTISPKEVFAGTEWFPTATPAPLFGMWPLLAGTLWVSFFAILFALPFGISIAVYMAEIASPKVRG